MTLDNKQKLCKSVLPKFLHERGYLDKLDIAGKKQEYQDASEAIAYAIDCGYLNPKKIGYQRIIYGNIVFTQTSSNILTDIGSLFLNS